MPFEKRNVTLYFKLGDNFWLVQRNVSGTTKTQEWDERTFFKERRNGLFRKMIFLKGPNLHRCALVT
jgi:hypothetical protein